MNFIKKTNFLFFLILIVTVQTYSQELRSIERVNEYIQTQIDQKTLSGAVVLIHHKGKNIMHQSFGYQDIKDNILMDTSSIFRIYSMTKPLTSLAAMILVDKGDITLEDSIVTYLPELRNIKVLEGKRESILKQTITIRDLMRHTSGFAYGMGLSSSKVDQLYNNNHPLFVSNSEEMINRLAQYPLQSQPGREYHYSISVDILGVIIERVSKMKLSEFMIKNIFEPLEMNDTYFKLPKSKLDRFCSMYGKDLRVNERYKSTVFVNERMESGGGGLVSTSSDYLKFCKLMLNKGIHNSDTLISSRLVMEMCKNQLPQGEGVYKIGDDVGIGFGLGFSVNLKEWGKYGHKGDYGWSGIGGTHFTISPSKNLIMIIMTQKQPFSTKIKTDLTPIIFDGIE